MVSGVLACRSLTRYFWLSLRLTTMADVQLDLFYCCLSVLCISRSSQCHWLYPRWHCTATPSQTDGADDTCADMHPMSSDDVAGVVLIIPSQRETVPRNPHKQILLIVIGGGHAVQILMIEKGWHDSTAATHDNGLDAAVNPTWSMVNGIWLVCKASIQDDLQLYLSTCDVFSCVWTSFGANLVV